MYILWGHNGRRNTKQHYSWQLTVSFRLTLMVGDRAWHRDRDEKLQMRTDAANSSLWSPMLAALCSCDPVRSSFTSSCYRLAALARQSCHRKPLVAGFHARPLCGESDNENGSSRNRPTCGLLLIYYCSILYNWIKLYLMTEIICLLLLLLFTSGCFLYFFLFFVL